MKVSPHCAGPGGCAFDRVYRNLMTGSEVRVQICKVDDGWLYRLGEDVHFCLDVDDNGLPECAEMNASVAKLL